MTDHRDGIDDLVSTPRGAEMRRVADALRAVIERFVATTAPMDVFDGVADDLEAIAARLGDYPQGHLYMGFAEAANAGDSEGPFYNSPLMGVSNPLAPPMHLQMLEDKVTGTVVCGSAYEGPPGHVHGGFVAAMFDELLGLTQSLSGKPGMTGRLTISYRSPTPLHTELRCEARVASISGRKIVCTGELYAGDTLCAEAEGLFISIDLERFAEMRDARDAGLPDARP
jgi:acyl-coenzyme A thioesterase PaaI-like protein